MEGMELVFRLHNHSLVIWLFAKLQTCLYCEFINKLWLQDVGKEILKLHLYL